ncbi:hypothetical protein Aple_024780 [Acrocarpospora pleiomorpha]|uniref:Uncharacterized protein n=1 Tax=Acrocarpospora pleiomorpha TaxID=90975 RepID=A0A5M3XFS2_9ACTN|nr:DUF6193 family natural product biosynthesis protein [Acrocarpospora pleiomorpha]GES19582.1 hypothetical protein Aple_024780 [Acrocarpospora pleiomorpha]
MRKEPDPAVLYPDVAELGSLAAALQAMAADQGLSLSMVASASDPLRHATAPSVVPHREALFVSAWVFERRWRICGSANNGILIEGVTDDLNDVPALVHGWAEGATLQEIDQAADFDLLTGRFEVPDGNSADVIAAQWQYTLKDAQQSDWPEYQALIEAAYAEPKLCKLYPYTSHWALSFSATPYPFTPSFVSIEASRGGGYTIREWSNGPALTRVPTPAEAISIAVNRLPADLGPNDRPTHP